MWLGHHPPSDGFLTAAELELPSTLYPLHVVICERCGLVQLDHDLDDTTLFSNSFVFRTWHNRNLRSHYADLVPRLTEMMDLSAGAFVVDIGSNDGTLLRNYPDDVQVLGVEPSRPNEIALEHGIPTRQAYFDESLAADIVEEHGEARIVTAMNVLAHAGDLHSFMRGVRRLLADDGVFVQESQYLLDLVENVQFDNIYLEHRRYYSLTSLRNLAHHFDLVIQRAERIDTQGGSIMTVASKSKEATPERMVFDLIEEERHRNLQAADRLRRFARRAEENRLELLDLLTSLRNEGQRIVGVGAAAKGVSRLNYCRIGPELVESLAEVNEYKIGRYVPGTHIPIRDESELFEDPPEYLLLLAWNLAETLIPKLRSNGFGGKFIIPGPDVRIVE